MLKSDQKATQILAKNKCSLFVLSITGPKYTHFSSRHHLHFFISVFFLGLLDAVYRVFFPKSQIIGYTIDTYLLFVNLVNSSLLFLIAGSISQPINPKNIETENNEKVEIKDGHIYRNNRRISPEVSASFFEWLSFSWMNSIIYFGFSNDLRQSNLYSLNYQQISRFAFKEFIDTIKFTNRKSIFLRTCKANKGVIVVQLFFSIAATLLKYMNPFFQQKLLEYITDSKGLPLSTAYTFVFGMFSVGVGEVLFNGISLWAGRRWNIRIFMMLDAEIYAKTLKHKDMSGKVEKKTPEGQDEKSKKEKPFSSVGKITNLMSFDADRLADFPLNATMLYTSPLEIFVAIFYLYNLLGFAAIVGLGIMVVFSPVTGIITKIMTKRYKEYSAAKDKRNALVNELLQGIRMIKYFAWEDNWEKRVMEARNTELSKLIRNLSANILLSITYLAVPALVSSASFIWYTKIAGNDLTASVAFVSITLFTMLRNPLNGIPDIINTVTESYVCLKRIESYIEEPEIGDGIVNEPITVPEGVSPETILARIGTEESVFRWHSGEPDSEPEPEVKDDAATEVTPDEQPVFSLKVPAFEFPTSELSIVCGPTGSGKSSFLHALLGEMDIVSGRVYLPSKTKLDLDTTYSVVDPEYPSLVLNKVAYVAQQAFLQHASIRDNILFGQEFDPVRYKKVLSQCALVKDLSIFSDGDRTEIGEKGISLSGGQKQRVALARAVYSHAKTVLLDDCLSAVDAHTAKHIYQRCIKGDLLKGRTVILVTHHVRLCLPAAKFVMKFERGAVAGYGYIESLREDDSLISLLGEEIIDNNEYPEDLIEEADEEFDLIDDNADVHNMIKEEKTEKGHVNYKVYSTYFYACGGWFFWNTLLLSFLIARALVFGENWWLRLWAASRSTSGEPIGNLTATAVPMIYNGMSYFNQVIKDQNVFQSWVHEDDQPRSVDYYISVYLCICFGFIFFNSLRSVFLYWGSLRGARIIFKSLLHRIIHSPMRFFDTTPIGRILNRFGNDLATVDINVARAISRLLEQITSLAVSVLFAVVVFFVGALYILIGLFYLRASRQFKRINSVTRSPIYSHFTETLMGLTTIRAYCQEDNFQLNLYQKIDNHIAPFYLLWMTNRWLYARIEFAGTFITLFIGVFLLKNLDTIDAGMAGISFFYARSFLDNIYWIIRMYTQVEMFLNSVERVQEYTEIEQEAPAVISGSRPPAAWPTTASVEVKDLVVGYAANLDPVLHGISFDIRSHEKVGIVGRTGSGKSTLTLSFFRFLEPTSGSIAIDGIDITHIGVQDLRSKLTIIPQDAVLFSGTIRSNLDPFEEYTDSAVWESLVRAHLSSESRDEEVAEGNATWAVTSLNQTVSDGGNNFSQGQRQLLCMARALLKNSRLIIMDEATASVDFETDKKIQNTIREEFVNSTLICIAHRLRTIMDYDRVLVLDQGKIIEYDTPANLLINDAGTGLFKSMCEKSGELDVLIEMAHSAEKLIPTEV
ncbi:P-loop containing nucleoside triphosphate hydrolase protein [Phycomyces blakesleeanus]|uniref:P-loop containing nucleoside triphosphate hydrolase protein n=1 Tax=Phycomyces blakesleeanus TaxID=4837 RepID=A0ABR3B998_PHYBL